MLSLAGRLPPYLRRRRTIVLAVLLVLLLGFLWVRPTLHSYLRAGAFTADVVLQLPVRPLAWATHAPSIEDIAWSGEVEGRGQLTLPEGDNERPAIILVLGADPAPSDDERVLSLTGGLARIGFVVLLTESDDLNAAVVLPSEIPRLVGAFEALEAHPRVNEEEIGYVALSAGGSLAIVAASQPEIADRVAYIVALGPYYDAESLAASVTSYSFRGPEGIEEWEPAGIARRVVRNTLLAGLPEADRAAIEAGEATQSAGGPAVAELLQLPTLDRAEELIASLPQAQRAHLEAVSPRYAIDGLRAPLYLLHDRSDEFIPWTESEEMAEAHEPDIYHRLDLFQHVEPDPGNIEHMLRDGWRILRLVVGILEDAR
ncbi:MAG: hypothetical protein F4056_07495 [Chloroflexi bacterium]|nr:hypothetical protein [Chloroflexota bacterium]